MYICKTSWEDFIFNLYHLDILNVLQSNVLTIIEYVNDQPFDQPTAVDKIDSS